MLIPLNDAYLENHLVKCPVFIQEMIDAHHDAPKCIIDFGCGHGVKAIGIAVAYPDADVIGVDITDAHKRAFEVCDRVLEERPANLSFQTIEPGSSLSDICRPDVIYSWSVLEHVTRSVLPGVIKDMQASLSPSGLVVTQIAPLYFSPFGSHLREFVDTEWAHLIFNHNDLREKVQASNQTGATGSSPWMFTRYEDLNRITATELAGYFDDAGLSVAQDVRRKVKSEIPASIASAYDEDALRTFELRFVHKKP